MISRHFRTWKPFWRVLEPASTRQIERADSATPASEGLPAEWIEAGPESSRSERNGPTRIQHRAVPDPVDPQRRSYRIRTDHGQLVRSCDELASHSGTQDRSTDYLGLMSTSLWRQAVVLRLPSHP